MATAAEPAEAKILILATISCAYPGADTVGQAHLSYPTNTYVLRIPSPVMLPEEFYFRALEKGIGGIIVMSCGEECPYEGAYHRLAARVDRVMSRMKDEGYLSKRIKLTAICTVCTKAFLKEVNEMNDLLKRIGPPRKGEVQDQP
jgi:coenzyme F420-reducing hydrogenase delta subunit|uniref:Hydrogenase iron-sulfur subunit n=1 Tax=Desulfomonile tiedjei TaxID=2358 RepID=A0A7C4EWL1_9BACT